jgi:hypothetical protein
MGLFPQTLLSGETNLKNRLEDLDLENDLGLENDLENGNVEELQEEIKKVHLDNGS